ncbi:sushi, von Willebrand factor type A, EGF and pentraxin domain-containing protein 1 isoform X2 [Exaiptasia diaphana]|uniref:Uncharacterized protein n=1 Tax=Exaiptasia diaphana TaxID=2652724 RepID=A0A913X4C3_EXADI|nr:sushi, von Willebrand factor type A, EGF and pentraxin domain-containing protein 1 isoform X2 [Exaiptasia diaphana]
MAAPRALLLLGVAVVQLFNLAWSCPPSCSWTTCRHEWRNDWSPRSSPQGRCVEQWRRAHIITHRHNGKGRCPSSQHCGHASQRQRLCSCKNTYSCPFHNWSGWSGHVSPGTCARQSRNRRYNEYVRYVTRMHNCNGIKSSCGAAQYDYRTYCKCRYASCTLGSWGAWTDLPSPVHKDHCASQKRTRGYTLVWKYLERRDNCNGVGPLSCPSNQEETREKVVTCPPLPRPAHGSWDRDDCMVNPQICKSPCKIQCNVRDGFAVSGPSTRICKSNGQWSTPWNTYCKDVQQPVITCPPSKVVGNDPGKDFATVKLPTPTAKDNSGKPPRITNDAGAAVKQFKIQSSVHTVKYTATDDAGNSASCFYHITVKDTERPSVVSCPDDIKVRTSLNNERVSWSYPTFKDNYDKPPHNPLRITSNTNPGNSFTWGVHKVMYTAFDRANNNASCEFFVDVGPNKCPLFDAPKHGGRACNKYTNNVKYEMLCNVQCKKGYAFAKDAPTVYMCQSDGTWHKMVYGSPVQVTNAEKKPWPDCAPQTGANSAVKEFTFYTGACVGDEGQAMNQIRQNFLKAIQQSPLANFVLCQVSQHQDCVVNNVKVYCGAESKRDGKTPAQRVIKFDFVMKFTDPSGDRKVDAAKVLKLMKDLEKLENYVKTKFPSQANIPGLQVVAQKGDVFCEPPKVKRILSGNESEIERSVCVECPVGSFYDNTTRTCADCPVGQYQDLEGQTHCKQCPKGKESVERGASLISECYDSCKAGEYTHKTLGGAVTCLACPLGSYQPKPLSKSCLHCPSGKTTTSVGATALVDCK